MVMYCIYLYKTIRNNVPLHYFHCLQCRFRFPYSTSEPRSPACPTWISWGALERRSTGRNHKATMSTPPLNIPQLLILWYVLSSRCTESHVHPVQRLSTPQHALGLGSGTTTECISLVCKTQLQIKFQFCSECYVIYLCHWSSSTSTLQYHTSALAVAVWSISVADRVVKTSTGKP